MMEAQAAIEDSEDREVLRQRAKERSLVYPGLSVVEYVTEEVRRQGHDVGMLEGIDRVRWMLEAWSYAWERAGEREKPTPADIIRLGRMIEPERVKGLRRVNVHTIGHMYPPVAEVPDMMDRLMRHRDDMTPLEFYFEFETVHPFLDGNGRAGKVLLNWLNGTLFAPVFPPADLFGGEILNP